MVQPFINSVDKEGEVGAVIIDGQFSHAFRKLPILELGGSLIGDEYCEKFDNVELNPAQ